MPGSMAFRAVLLSQAAILVFVWWVGVGWLASVGPLSRVRHAIMPCGCLGAVALVLYVTYLGSDQPFYEFMKRFGIYFYFLGTALAQILLTWAMPRSSLRTTMLAIIGTPFVLGVINLAQKALLSHPNNIENRIEWISALLMQVWFVLLFLAWRRSGLSVIVRTDSTIDRH